MSPIPINQTSFYCTTEGELILWVPNEYSVRLTQVGIVDSAGVIRRKGEIRANSKYRSVFIFHTISTYHDDFLKDFRAGKVLRYNNRKIIERVETEIDRKNFSVVELDPMDQHK